jgi:hypothetical protein
MTRNSVQSRFSLGRSTITEWWSKKLRKDDPNILPYKARRCVAFYIESIALIFPLNATIPHKIAGIGLILGIFGASVLWWETIVSDQDLQGVRNEMRRYVSSSTRVYFTDFRYLTLWYVVGFMPWFLLMGMLYLIWKANSNYSGLSLPLRIVFLTGFYVCAPFVPLGLTKLTRR